jgi:hypothetical protein
MLLKLCIGDSSVIRVSCVDQKVSLGKSHMRGSGNKLARACGAGSTTRCSYCEQHVEQIG